MVKNTYSVLAVTAKHHCKVMLLPQLTSGGNRRVALFIVHRSDFHKQEARFRTMLGTLKLRHTIPTLGMGEWHPPHFS